MPKHIATHLILIIGISLLAACGGGGAGDGGVSCSYSPNALSFSAEEGQPAPASQDVTVVVNSGVILSNVSHPSFVAASFTSTGDASGLLRVTPVDPATATPGFHQDTISVGGCGSMTVSYEVIGLPRASASPMSLNFSAPDGDVPQPSTVDLTYAGGSTTWTTTVDYWGSDTGWLSVTPASGSAMPANITVAPQKLPQGTYKAYLHVNYVTKDITRTIDIPVNYTSFAPIRASGDIAITLDTTTPSTSLSTSATLFNNAPTPVGWTATTNAPWLQLVNTSGTVSTQSPFAMQLVPTELAKLEPRSYAAHRAVVTVTTDRVGVPPISFNVDVKMLLPLLNVAAPYVAAPHTAGTAITRGMGFTAQIPLSLAIGNTGRSASVEYLNSTTLRVTYEALPEGQYTLSQSNQSGVPRSTAALVIKAPPSANTAFVGSIGAKTRPVFDSERNAIYTINTGTGSVERYQLDPAGTWQSTSLALPNARDLAMRPDGKELIAVTTNQVVHIDLVTFTTTGAVEGSVYEALDGIAIRGDNIAYIANHSVGTGLPYKARFYRTDLRTFVSMYDYCGNNGPIVSSGDYTRVIGLAGDTPSYPWVYDAIGDINCAQAYGTPPTAASAVAQIDRTGDTLLAGSYGVYRYSFSQSTTSSSLTLAGTLTAPTTIATAALTPDGAAAYVVTIDNMVYRVPLATPVAGKFSSNVSPVALAAPGASPSAIVTPDGGTIVVVGAEGLSIVPAF